MGVELESGVFGAAGEKPAWFTRGDGVLVFLLGLAPGLDQTASSVEVGLD